MEEKLELLLADGIVDEVVGRLKSGKEADIWIVTHGGETVAAKIYKERQSRSFRNNAAYKEGRVVANSRTQRAIDRGSRFGQVAAEEAWKSAEADALYKLHAHGVRTPAPVMFYEGVLLMQLVLDADGRPAPRLIDVALTPETAAEIYRDLRAQAVRMLDADLIHGDLSPYNVLVAAAGPTLIDFPQVVAAAHNSRSEFFFLRDLESLRQHLSAYDKSLHGRGGDSREIWRAYVHRELTPDFVPSGRVVEERPRRPPPREHNGPPQRGGRPGGPRPAQAPQGNRQGNRPSGAGAQASPGRRPSPPAGGRPPPQRQVPLVTHVARLPAAPTPGGSGPKARDGGTPPPGAPNQDPRGGSHRRHRHRRHGGRRPHP
jgi:RIO kinase 1